MHFTCLNTLTKIDTKLWFEGPSSDTTPFCSKKERSEPGKQKTGFFREFGYASSYQRKILNSILLPSEPYRSEIQAGYPQSLTRNNGKLAKQHYNKYVKAAAGACDMLPDLVGYV